MCLCGVATFGESMELVKHGSTHTQGSPVQREWGSAVYMHRIAPSREGAELRKYDCALYSKLPHSEIGQS